MQPYLIVQGENLATIRQTYLIADKVRYQFSSVQQAFDLLFKVYHTLKIQYPPQSGHILQLIQQGVYKINTKYDVVYPENLDILKLFQ